MAAPRWIMASTAWSAIRPPNSVSLISGATPIAQALEDGVPGAKRHRKVTPRTAGSRDPHDGLVFAIEAMMPEMTGYAVSLTGGLSLRKWRLRLVSPVHPARACRCVQALEA